MSHPSHDQLWALERAELDAGEAAQLQAHLAGCAQCREAHGSVLEANALVRLLPAPPPMPPALAHRVGAKLVEDLDARQAKRLAAWWRFEWLTPKWALVAAAAVAVAFVLAYALTQPAPSTPTPSAQLAVTAPPSPNTTTTAAPVVPETATATAPAKKLSVRVASAKRATSAGGALAKAAVLQEGSNVTTERGGSLWLQLPDGSRAGLTGESEVQLATLEEKTLALSIAKGKLALMVPHRDDRVLTVRAGDLLVTDLGTQFLVSREVARTVVAVEEGSVEVNVPGQRKTLTAGHAIAWHDGELEEFAWNPPPAAIVPARVTGQPVTPEPAEVMHAAEPSEATEAGALTPGTKLTNEDDDLPPPEAAPQEPVGQPSSGADEEWAQLPTQAQAPADPNSPPPVVAAPVDPPPATPMPHRQHNRVEVSFSLGAIERRMNELTRALRSPFAAVDSSMRATRAREIARLADAGDCPGVLVEAERWLRDPPSAPAEELALKRVVLRQKLRCLTRLNRETEAALVTRQLEEL